MSENRNTPNETDAPDRIWSIDEDHYADRNPNNVCATEYIRADIHKAEIERLRAALQRIVAMDQDYMKCRRYSDEIARAALKGGEG